MASIELQQVLFLHIKSLIPANISMVDEIAGLLEISNDSAYRRIRGDKALSFDEIRKLSKHYQISLDRLMNIDSNSIVFFGRPVEVENYSYETYLKEMLFGMKSINSAGKKQMYYEAKDLPIFYYFQFPELAAFKYFFWMKSALAYPQFASMQFEDHEINKVLHQTGLEIINNYNQIPSVEVWGVETVNATLRQLEYYKYAGVFKKAETIERLYDQMIELIKHIKHQAELGEKFLFNTIPRGDSGNFQLYFNELFLGHNSILAETDGVLTTFLNYGVLNYISTSDPDFCSYIRKSFENTIKKSLLISSVSEKERNRYFNLVFERIESSRKLSF